ncbi:MAG: biotin-dependent carboxyltransferase family protein, partial [Fimbriimonadales bacterium]
NGEPVPMYEAIRVKAGDELKMSHFGDVGFRSYIAVAGGIDVPVYLGSKSTCVFGSYGGFEGRKLQPGDVLKTGVPSTDLRDLEGRRIKDSKRPELKREFVMRAMPGPNCVPDYVTEQGMDYLYSHPFKVLLNSNRSAYRLEEIPPEVGFFARENGGVGGSHPSNVLDHAYAIPGTMNVCGNTPIMLIADGPTLGGYMCCLQVIFADLWMIGQGTPGRDLFRFQYCTAEEAIEARREMDEWLSEASLA